VNLWDHHGLIVMARKKAAQDAADRFKIVTIIHK
jgi:hypothetical protein